MTQVLRTAERRAFADALIDQGYHHVCVCEDGEHWAAIRQAEDPPGWVLHYGPLFGEPFPDCQWRYPNRDRAVDGLWDWHGLHFQGEPPGALA